MRASFWRLAFAGFLIASPGYAGAEAAPTKQIDGTWKVIDIVEAGLSAADSPKEARELGKVTVKVTDGRLILASPEGEEEFAVTRIAKHRPAAIDLRDKEGGPIYRGIYQRDGKRLKICIQFWMVGDAKASARPRSFKEARDRKMDYGPTLLILEQN
jgi:uncharacterized protein (TIGR03067 family)